MPTSRTQELQLIEEFTSAQGVTVLELLAESQARKKWRLNDGVRKTVEGGVNELVQGGG